MPTKQILERQNKDLRIRLDNSNIRRECDELKYTEMLKSKDQALKDKDQALKDKDQVISMLQNALNGVTQDNVELKLSNSELTQKNTLLLDDSKKYLMEIARLKSIINKDSSNSSKPPSTNGFKTIPNSREKSTKSRGGQPGHQGHRLRLPKNLDELIKNGDVEMNIVDHTNGSDKYQSRFVVDLRVITTITEYRFREDDKLPERLYNEVSYGDNLRSLCVLLSKEGIIADKRLADSIIGGISNGVITLSPATIERFCTDYANSLVENGELESIKNDLLNGEVINTDDTEIRSTVKPVYTIDENGQEQATLKESEKTSFKVTIRTYSNNRSTFYTANPQKDKKGVIRDQILLGYLYTLCHDHESKFFSYGSRHAVCGDHLCRELKGLYELQNISWAKDMRIHMLGMNNHKKQDIAKGIMSCDIDDLEAFIKRYDDLVKQGRICCDKMDEEDFGYHGFNLMVKRLTYFKICHILFMQDYTIPFTNSLAERDLRPEKTKQKVSGAHRSWSGVKTHTIIRSFISTAKKRKLKLLPAIQSVIRGEKVLE